MGTFVPIIDSQLKLFSPLEIEDVTASNWVRLHVLESHLKWNSPHHDENGLKLTEIVR